MARGGVKVVPSCRHYFPEELSTQNLPTVESVGRQGPEGEVGASQAKEALTDSFGRRHNYLRISLTERCNLRCT